MLMQASFCYLLLTKKQVHYSQVLSSRAFFDTSRHYALEVAKLWNSRILSTTCIVAIDDGDSDDARYRKKIQAACYSNRTISRSRNWTFDLRESISVWRLVGNDTNLILLNQ